MGSYVISVSAGTGCYRHIQISKTATLYQLHKAILDAFAFDDDHEHAFFLDNRLWSGNNAFFSSQPGPGAGLTKKYSLQKLHLEKGQQFKYLFDYGDEWVFQCKLLREVEEQTKCPRILRSVGDAPEQYPDWEDEDSDWEDEEQDTFEEYLQEIADSITLDDAQTDAIRAYLNAAERLYGLVPLSLVYDLYNRQNEPVSVDEFVKVAVVLSGTDDGIPILPCRDAKVRTPEEFLAVSEIISEYLLTPNRDADIAKLRRQQSGKPYHFLPKEEFLRYAEGLYFPDIPERRAMITFLRRKAAKLPFPAEQFCSAIQDLMVIDAPFQEVLNILKMEGLKMNGSWSLQEFAHLFQELNNATHKYANRGYSPNEFLALHASAGQSPGQLSLFEAPPPEKPRLTLVGAPPRNAPCPCGSGRKYKNCCGK